MEIVQVDGALYPVCVVRGELPPTMLDNELKGISRRRTNAEEPSYIFPLWHAERLAGLFGEPSTDYGASVMRALREQAKAIDAIRRGEHELLKQAPAYFFEHQKQGWAMMMVSKSFALFFEPGLGKTATVIELLRVRRMPTLVICPLSLIRATWIPELRSRAPELRVANVSERAELASDSFDVYLLNNHKMLHHRHTYKTALLEHVRRVVVDESSMMKSTESKTTRAILEDYGGLDERYILSGTPAPNGPHEYWAQINLVRPGLLPLTPSEFNATWFRETGIRRGGFKAKVGAVEDLMPRVASCSLFREKAECIDIPEKVFAPRFLTLPQEPRKIRDAYVTLRDELRTEVKQAYSQGIATQKIGGIFARIMKLRELTSGFIVGSDGHWNLVSKHKFDVLDEILEELGPRQCVIWMNFIADFEYLPLAMPHRSQRAGVIYGGTTDPVYRQRVIDMFLRHEIQYLFANPRSLGHGVTLFDPKSPSICQDCVYFDLDYSLETFGQSQDRLHRIGQRHNVTYYPILCEDTIDMEIYARLQAKREDADNALDFLK
jgi:SNF2 family DNA or RNA helicase